MTRNYEDEGTTIETIYFASLAAITGLVLTLFVGEVYGYTDTVSEWIASIIVNIRSAI